MLMRDMGISWVNELFRLPKDVAALGGGTAAVDGPPRFVGAEVSAGRIRQGRDHAYESGEGRARA